MPTALAATFQAATGSDPARVLLAVTGAPSVSPLYTGSFATTVDGWTGTAGTTLTFNAGGPVTSLELRSGLGSAATFSRTVAGLTIGNTYTWSVMATKAGSVGTITLGVTGIGTTAAFDPGTGPRIPISYAFTATATSHVITVAVPNATGYRIDTALVLRTTAWGGTTIRRTDVNGTNVPVRENPGGQDTTGVTGSATMTVTDYEAALVGSVVYTVTDGNGGTATATVVNTGTPGTFLTLPATSTPGTPTPPLFVAPAMVTGYGEASSSNGSLHAIIGRADPIANPGPLSLRAGTFKLWCADYPTAEAVRTLLANGDTAHLRQSSFGGLDLYLVARGVAIDAEEVTATQRWSATVTYAEVLAP